MGESSPFVEFMLEIILKSMQDIQKSSQKSSQKILISLFPQFLRI